MNQQLDWMFLTFRIPALAIAATGFITNAHAGEIIVDSSGLGDHSTIQAAVDAATNGDLIIVRPGQYGESISIDGKALRIVAQTPDSVLIQGTVDIANIGVRQQVGLTDLRVEAPVGTPLGNAALEVTIAQGPVTIRGCKFVGASTVDFSHPASGDAAEFSFADRVTLTDSLFEGGHSNLCSGGGGTGTDGGRALVLQNSRLAAWNLGLTGGAGADCVFQPGGTGGTAVDVTNSECLFVSSTIVGGRGGTNNDVVPIPGGDGGAGLTADATSEVLLQISTPSGGAGGFSLVGNDGAPGAATAGAGLIRVLAGPARLLAADTFVREGFAHDFEVQGTPGDQATLLIFSRLPFFYDALRSALGSGSPSKVRAMPRPLIRIPLGLIPASGTLQASAILPSMAALQPSADLQVVVWTGDRFLAHLLAQPLKLVAINCASLAPDCDANGTSDLCELLDGSASDCDGNGVSDVCQQDCNGNGVEDSCDIAGGTSVDANGDGIPDECQPTNATFFVDASAPAGGNGSAAMPFRNIQSGVDVALPGDEIVLLDGIYTGARNRTITLDSRPILIRSANGPANCTIDAQDMNRIFVTDNSQNGTGATIQGIRLTHGKAVIPSASGGAIKTFGASLTIRDCVFDTNAATTGGGAIHSAGGVHTFGCVFVNNSSSSSGGALELTGTDNLVNDCLFEVNHSTGGGGAIFASAALINRSRFLGNTSGSRGGAVATNGFPGGSTPFVFVNQCLMVGNTSIKGGGISSNGIIVSVSNCTLVENIANSSGGAAHTEFNGQVRFFNTILSGNSAPAGKEIATVGGGSTLSLEFSTVDGGLSSILEQNGGVLTSVNAVYGLAPIFMDADGPDNNALTLADNDYRLMLGSVQIDAGSNALIPADSADEDGDGDLTEAVPVDLDGQPRRIDELGTPDLGQGNAPLVDQGAFERQ